ncbi:UNVERIFIED_CONTAM: Calcium-dependent protein kinase [Sesamum radiatum]|uniref:non-specific serine/threonine protein kinase n=1 Tax=Sesamum radiatum TaxID=300843 RepID=A0AAW2RI46_SESRA
MGSCFSTTKVSGANGNAPSITTTAVNFHFGNRRAAASKPGATKQEVPPNNPQKTRETNKHRSNQQQEFFKEARLSDTLDFEYPVNHAAQLCYNCRPIYMVLPIAVEDVKREVKILKALAGHENVVHFYNAFEDDSYVYIVMELCEGGELLDRILSKKDSRYTEKDAAIVVRQMLKVAAECHLHGFVHRDMKPENFLFKSPKEDSPLKATDFGLSDFIRPGKKFQDIVGSAYYVAPEVLKRKSGPESDVWSIGVITYILLCGRRPFWDKTEDGIFKEVLRNKPDFRRKPWPGISNAAKDFVRKLLMKDPRARLTAAQALSHPWVREGGEASEIPLDISVLSNMRQFVKYSRFKQFALRALASTLDDEELADLRDQFDAIDVDKNGVISLEEMRQAMEKDLPWKMKDSRVVEILQAIDSNTDGLVDFSEFVAATLHVHQLEEHNSEKWQQRSQAAFEKFDVDRDGFITPEELKLHSCLRGSIDPLLEEADLDKDGRISLSEFRRLLRTASISSRGVNSPAAHRGATRRFNEVF